MKISSFHLSRQSWGLLALSAAIFEAVALYFQYGMGLEPCIMCIYQRFAMLGLLAAGLIGMISPRSFALRSLAFVSWGVGSIWGYFIAREHISMQTTTDPFAFTCDFVPNFPAFMPLHEWLPSFFAATGDCGKKAWSFAGLSMPGWMEIIFAFYSVAFFLFLFFHVTKRS
ncbi:disulfide bond formation protein B [Pseudoalteromonas sp. GCY]|uniref:disulfide bond formation protein DsbB n=1 Tax=Pseudoalteromonas sp. GCY TaxID=2003316 RepID=UPI000BFEEF27|nr:disulfide bond formation protein DsbB [Pseudoalteromonas sp. GCY]PHI38074.1 disulfide bond formation protein B [Pseudoalteromonas sp. GCY]QQQ66135.1 disulfide bond formation protein DsbB [Pseudoalteromonas sp. GCY]